MKLHRDIGVSQKTAWHMLQRIRKAFDDRDNDNGPFDGPMEVDESYFGGKRKNMSNARRKAQTGRGTAVLPAVVGMKDRDTNQVRAEVVATTDTATLECFVEHHARTRATVYTDEAAAYRGLSALRYRHEIVQHRSASTCGTRPTRTAWKASGRCPARLRRRLPQDHPKHLGRYVSEFSGWHNIRSSDTPVQMARLVEGMVGKRLRYHRLVADNGLPSGARS